MAEQLVGAGLALGFASVLISAWMIKEFRKR